jgi:hypothetical protein
MDTDVTGHKGDREIASVVVAVVVHRPMERPQETVSGIDRRESSTALVARNRPPDGERIG